jgi:hypothetical protein
MRIPIHIRPQLAKDFHEIRRRALYSAQRFSINDNCQTKLKSINREYFRVAVEEEERRSLMQ